LKKAASYFLSFSLLLGILIVASHHCAAQSVPDTARMETAKDTSVHITASANSSKVVKDTATINADSLAFAMRPHPYQPNPKKSGLYSAVLPGLGQANNHQYWKIPIVYAGLGTAVYVFIHNYTLYQGYRAAYISRLPDNPNPTDKYALIYNTAALQQLQSDYSKYVDLTALFGGLGYFLQVLDAITSAHLKNFDISRDISMHLAPVGSPYGVGFGMVMNYKYPSGIYSPLK